ncbi:hypothetical protein [Gandjariella thermophila]|nr:hypothetical protein [Gandjariella thermophila]
MSLSRPGDAIAARVPEQALSLLFNLRVARPDPRVIMDEALG